MTIKQYNGTPATFYIQCKGEHSGRPLKNPIPNCFSIFTDIPNAYEIAYAAFVSKHYHRHIKGSCVPYIRIADAKEVLSLFMGKIDERKQKSLNQIEQIDTAIISIKNQLALLEQMKVATARNFVKSS
jgi:hypothetical protein